MYHFMSEERHEEDHITQHSMPWKSNGEYKMNERDVIATSVWFNDFLYPSYKNSRIEQNDQETGQEVQEKPKEQAPVQKQGHWK